MTVFEGVCLGFFGGVVTTLIYLLSGVFHGVDKGKSDDSNSNVNNASDRNRDRSSNNGSDTQMEPEGIRA